ncbi:hypothetical protein [Microbacterium sp. Leaf320]|uniref:hypothetical protein n=1 Tax=Microbacterium sp. Leaf320 TaxID=1736334 RepID=UPI0006F2A459|nr:hypothetical protein [Microbacterium sp. Leaf320]KQQ65717.1 hypothetical protein ASF63_10170 [Microbacterium sp. Leaf320]
MTVDVRKPRCFIAMPITTRADDVGRFDGDSDHWIHVMETIFVPAVEKAGYEAIRPVTQGSHMIHGEIIKHLSTADMVLCDLSTHNPNVFFELGVRTSLNKPVALVRDEHTTLPFDTSGLNTHEYDSSLRGWSVGEQVSKLAAHLRASEASCAGTNPLWRHFGLTITAAQPDPEGSITDAKLQLIQEDLSSLKRVIATAAIRSSAVANAPAVVQFLAEGLAPFIGAPLLSYSFYKDGFDISLFYPPTVGDVDTEGLTEEARSHGYELVRLGRSDENFWLSLDETDNLRRNRATSALHE